MKKKEEILQWRGVYTAPHANETECDQSLALELKIPPLMECVCVRGRRGKRGRGEGIEEEEEEVEKKRL